MRRVGNLARNAETNTLKLVCSACGRWQDIDVMKQCWSYDLPIEDAIETVECEGCGLQKLVQR
jgi:hypothetical protein